LKGEVIDAILTQFIKALKLPKGEQLITDKAKLRFILSKIASGN
jgi:hypothetical protein